MQRRSLIGALLSLAIVGALAYGGWTWVTARDQQFCAACRRVIHEHTRTLATDGARELPFCCPACALSEEQQAAKRLTITSVADYATGNRLSPQSAYLVRGSDVTPCAHLIGGVSEDKRPLEATFDRCSPSVIAFASREAAAAFAGRHGGEVITYADLLARSGS